MTEDQAPYELPVLRLKSLQIKEVKIKKEPATRVTVAWERQMPDGSWDAMRYGSVREPQAAFWKALSRLVPPAIAVLELPVVAASVDRDGIAIEVVGIKMSYDDEENQIATTILSKPTISGPALLETPALPASGDYEHLQATDYHQALLAVQAEALQFAANISG